MAAVAFCWLAKGKRGRNIIILARCISCGVRTGCMQYWKQQSKSLVASGEQSLPLSLLLLLSSCFSRNDLHDVAICMRSRAIFPSTRHRLTSMINKRFEVVQPKTLPRLTNRAQNKFALRIKNEIAWCEMDLACTRILLLVRSLGPTGAFLFFAHNLYIPSTLINPAALFLPAKSRRKSSCCPVWCGPRWSHTFIPRFASTFSYRAPHAKSCCRRLLFSFWASGIDEKTSCPTNTAFYGHQGNFYSSSFGFSTDSTREKSLK